MSVLRVTASSYPAIASGMLVVLEHQRDGDLQPTDTILIAPFAGRPLRLQLAEWRLEDSSITLRLERHKTCTMQKMVVRGYIDTSLGAASLLRERVTLHLKFATHPRPKRGCRR